LQIKYLKKHTIPDLFYTVLGPDFALFDLSSRAMISLFHM